MKKFVLIGAIILIVLLGVGFFLFKGRSNATGEGVLKVSSSTPASIFLNNESIGKTPYEEKVKSGEYTLKLVPESTSTVSWEGRVVITPNLLTYVNRELNDSELTSAGEMLQLEKSTGDIAEISVISVPDAAIVTIDGSERGTTPMVIRDLAPGNYELSISAIGYTPRSVKIKTTAGYRLTASFDLAGTAIASPAPSPSAEADASPAASGKASPKPSSKASPGASAKASPKASGSTSKNSPPPKPYIEVLETPTNYLNVRKEPSTAAEIVAQVNPGEFYALLEEETVSNRAWFKIEYESGSEGWVSSQYAKKFE